MSGQPDFKTAARDVADRDRWEQIIAAKTGPCRVCGTQLRIEHHHLVPRSQRGDDTEANIVPLCNGCHDSITNRRAGWEEIASALRHALSPLELAYVRSKKGKWWLDRHLPSHGVNGKVCARCRKPLNDADSHSEPRKTGEWTLTVPDDAEDGRDVLDALVDGLADDLGFKEKSSRLRRYHAVVRALAFATINKDHFIREAA